ncbi:alkaline phytoceramidase-like protein [Cordyceps fumosorosea ARSEF 2679]|uniref:Alkaline phytoceramidase-like protein n=1 Tax=Cordyceps fumosorosea (strain ARSEF 2679) TaxID=1081104 RepID=A0A167GVQ0_CORFA|nr:alkaline phytoceramidase-like protein [Cordyceps fumosorosea ARSEF 2679]OAA47162.1 alkaline phytoceramidase-like protein [Cordyceps fumosorosea ARSEF 2679]
MPQTSPFRTIRFPYPEPFDGWGFWGRQTSTLNWCEEVILLNLGADPMQLWDELSMIYTTCLMMFASFSYSRSMAFSYMLGLGLLGLSAFISVYYHVTKDPEFHQAVYGILTAIVVFHGMWVMERRLRPALRARHGDEGSKLLGTLWAMVTTGLSVFLSGFLVWNLDNIYCTQIRALRRELAREIEAQAASAQQQIGIARTQIAGKQREQRLVKLTLSELSSLPKDTVIFEGVGKMFAALPVTEITQKLENQTKDLDSEVEKLGKRLVYLETTHKNSREHIEQMLRKT